MWLATTAVRFGRPSCSQWRTMCVWGWWSSAVVVADAFANAVAVCPLEQDNSHDEDFRTTWVADVVVAHRNGKHIKRFLKARQMLSRVRAARAAIKKYCTASKEADPGEGGRGGQALRLVPIRVHNLKLLLFLCQLRSSRHASSSQSSRTSNERCVCVCAIAHMVATNTAATAPIQFNRADVREDSTCVCAYVTFENEESFMNCLEDYKHSTSL